MKALVVGGNSGIGLSIVCELLEQRYEKIYVVGKEPPVVSDLNQNIEEHFKKRVCFYKKNLLVEDYSFFDEINDIDTLIISVGFGRVASFENLLEEEISNLIKINYSVIVKILKHYYHIINSRKDFYTAVMVSICGRIASPLFSVYGSCKGGIRFLIENINAELANTGIKNRILEVSPGSIKGTGFNGGKTNLLLLSPLAKEIVRNMYNRETLFIPEYDIYKNVIERYNNDPKAFAKQSFEYKINNNRLSSSPQLIVGYLSGTFDLFHIGHLNLLRRAKEQCDYLIVSVHDSGAWKGKETFIPYNERRAIVESIKYVDKVVEDYVEDSDAWEKYHFNKLFVGSDYKGTERFNRYEKLFDGKVEIVYFPYTKGTSSTQLRDAIKKK